MAEYRFWQIDTFSLQPYLTAAEPSAINAGVSKDMAANMLGCREADLSDTPIEVCSGGLPWLIVQLNSIVAVTNLLPDLSLIAKICRDKEAIGVTIYCADAELGGCNYHLRTFAPGAGIREDPVCGSGSVAVAIHLAGHCRADEPGFSFMAEQGLEVHRHGVLHLSVDHSDGSQLRIRLGGHAVRTMRGTLEV